jgi:hypothetical protein
MTNEEPPAGPIPAPITPDYDRVPEHPTIPEPDATAESPAPAAPAKQQRKATPIPRHKRKLQSRRKHKHPEWDTPEFKRDHKLLDAQLRARSLQDFVREHDLWPAFVAAHPWW